MIFPHHQIDFNILNSFPFFKNFGAFFDWHPVKNYPSSIFTISSLAPSLTMFEILVLLYMLTIRSYFFVLRFPNATIQPFMTNRTLATLFSLYTNQIRVPFVNHKMVYHMMPHLNRNRTSVGLFSRLFLFALFN